MCGPSKTFGKKRTQVNIPPEVKKAWEAGGTSRTELLSIVIEAQGDKDDGFKTNQRPPNIGYVIWLYIMLELIRI